MALAWAVPPPLAPLLVLLLGPLAPAAGEAGRPNVLFMVVDDLRPEIAGPYGQAFMHTPNLMRLADRSTTFTAAHCQVPLCSPSRTSVLTGLRPDTTKVWTIGPYFRDVMEASSKGTGLAVATLPQYFRQYGYRVTGAGKVFHAGTSSGGPSSSEGGGDGGYPFQANGSWSQPYFFCDQFYNGTMQSPAMQQWPNATGVGCAQSEACLTCLQAAGSLGGPTFKPAWKGAPCPDECYPDGAAAAEAVRQLEAYNASAAANGGRLPQPFFLAVGFKRPHLGWFAPQRFFDLYSQAPLALAKHRLPPGGMPEVAFGDNGEICGMDGVHCNASQGFNLVPEAKHLELRRAYAAAVSFMDSQLGKVLDALDRSAFGDNTALVFWGDHGYQLGEHGLWCKVTNFELATRVPLMIAPPRGGAFARAGRGTTSAELVELLDVYPTLVDIAGLPPNHALEGKSLARHLLADEPGPGDGAVVLSQIEHGGLMGFSLRTTRWRYTEWVMVNKNFGNASPPQAEWCEDPTSKACATELYDHRGDDGTDMDKFENQNLAVLPEYADAVLELHDLLVRRFAGGRSGTATAAVLQI